MNYLNYNTDFNKNILIICLFSVLSLFIVKSWFESESIIAGAETGLPFFNLNYTEEISKYPYLEAQFGVPNPFYIHFLFIWKILSVFSSIGFSNITVQAILFFVLLVVPLITIPLLVRYLFIKADLLTSIFASVFYLLNYYTVSQIFNRFLYSLIFLWSLLPLMFYLWIKWVKNKNFFSFTLFLLINIIFAGTYALPTGIVAVWLLLLGYSFFEIITEKDKGKYIQLIIRSIVGVIAWMILGLWWIIPILIQSNNVYFQNTNKNDNLNSLSEVSKYFPNNIILTLKQKYFFDGGSELSVFSNSTAGQISTVFLVYFMIVGVLKAIKLKVFFVLFVTFVSWFLSKGVNDPLGLEFYKFMYEKIPLFQVFRNPYEKIGVVFLLCYTVLVSLGLSTFTKNAKKVMTTSMLALLFISFSDFYFNDKYFPGKKRINVPPSYDQANNLLTNEGRALILPFLYHPSVKYSWGFEGEDPSVYLFEKQVVSSPTSIASIDRFYTEFGDSLNQKQPDNILGVTGIRYIVIDNYRISKPTGQGDVYTRLLEVDKNIKLLGVFDNLKVYENTGVQVPLVYATDKYLISSDIKETIMLINGVDFDVLNQVVINAKNLNKIELKGNLDLENPQNITFVKLNPMHYRVFVKGSTGPFILVLANNFNPLWTSKSGYQVFGEHFQVNGYANGWVVERLGDYEIDLKFKS